jgi:hypothetical protein
MSASVSKRAKSKGMGLGLLCAALLFSVTARAQGDMPDPKVAMPILLKVLTYDQHFDTRGTGDFVVLVASEPGQAAAREQILGVLKGLSVSSIKNRPLKFVAAEFKDEASLSAEIAKAKAQAVLAVPGISANGVVQISEVAQDNQVYTLALDSTMVEKALAVGVTNNGGRPQIVINEKASKQVGVKFETSVLKLAKVIQ